MYGYLNFKALYLLFCKRLEILFQIFGMTLFVCFTSPFPKMLNTNTSERKPAIKH